MGLFQKFREGLQKTHNKLAHEIKRLVTLSPKLSGGTVEELEAALIAADLGMPVTRQIVAAVKTSFETQGRSGLDVFDIARREVDLIRLDDALIQLSARDPRQCQIVELRYFGGLTIPETAGVLAISPATVKRDWLVAKAWLYRELAGKTDDESRSLETGR